MRENRCDQELLFALLRGAAVTAAAAFEFLLVMDGPSLLRAGGVISIVLTLAARG
jgi:hypothetical protein